MYLYSNNDYVFEHILYRESLLQWQLCCHYRLNHDIFKESCQWLSYVLEQIIDHWCLCVYTLFVKSYVRALFC